MATHSLDLNSMLKARALASSNGLVNCIESILVDVNRLEEAMNRELRYRHTPDEVFAAKVAGCRSARELNGMYWREMGASVKVYTLSVTWRMLELLGQTIEAMNNGGVLGPAILARSLIELTTSVVLNGAVVRKQVDAARKRWYDDVMLSGDLEKMLNKAMHGTRLVEADHALRQTNILTQIQKLSKFEGYEDVYMCYERLCEVAHPNALGNVRFWSDSAIPQKDGSFIYSGRPDQVNAAVVSILDDVLWSVSWAGGNVVRGFSVLNEQVTAIMQAFPSPTDRLPPRT